jgi:alcohol dehydrogenase class IV
MTTATNFAHATPAFRTFCGERALASLPRELDRLRCRRAVIVTGPWLADCPEVLKALDSAIGDRSAGTFDAVEEHSPVPSVEAAARFMSEAGADAVIAVGGGSCIVTARAASILLAEGRPVGELCTRRDEAGTLVSPKLLAPKMPNWVVPTTPITAYAKAGSAVRDPATGQRLALFDPKTRAQGIFVDPRVAQTTPAGLVSSAALNAFSMAVEGLQANVGDPLADALLIHALRELSVWLPRAQADPGDPEPRIRLMLAALLCGQGSDYVGGGLAQALSHAAGPRSSVANGVVETMLLPHTMRFAAAEFPGSLTRVAEALGCPPGGVTDEHAVGAVQGFTSQLGVPLRLRDAGVGNESLAEIADHAMDDWSITRVPRRPSRDDLAALLAEAW